jgi:hypothetical protein
MVDMVLQNKRKKEGRDEVSDKVKVFGLWVFE